jgi:hypothetical protein
VEATVTSDNVIYVAGTFRSDFIFGDKKSRLDTKNNIFLSELYDCAHAELDLGEDIEVCGDSHVLKAKGKFMSYEWSTGSTGNQTVITETGNYTLHVRDKNGCPAEDEIFVNLHPLPLVDLGEDKRIKSGETLRLSAPYGYKDYIWNGEKGKAERLIRAEDLSAGENLIELLVIDHHACQNRDAVTVTVEKDEIYAFDADNPLSVKISPNPSNGIFNLELQNINPAADLILELYTPDGKLVKQEKLRDKSPFILKELNISKQAQGDYILKILNGQSIINKTIIKIN